MKKLGGDAIIIIVVVTHAQALQKRKEESVVDEKEAESGVLPNPMESCGKTQSKRLLTLVTFLMMTYLLQGRRGLS